MNGNYKFLSVAKGTVKIRLLRSVYWCQLKAGFSSKELGFHRRFIWGWRAEGGYGYLLQIRSQRVRLKISLFKVGLLVSAKGRFQR
jgi:hypothetical protein